MPRVPRAPMADSRQRQSNLSIFLDGEIRSRGDPKGKCAMGGHAKMALNPKRADDTPRDFVGSSSLCSRLVFLFHVCFLCLPLHLAVWDLEPRSVHRFWIPHWCLVTLTLHWSGRPNFAIGAPSHAPSPRATLPADPPSIRCIFPTCFVPSPSLSLSWDNFC